MPPPVYQIPTATSFTLLIDGSRLTKTESTDVVMIGPGYDVGIQNITLAPGKKSTAVFAPSGNSITYTASSSESPDIIYGIETSASDYSFYIKGVELESGAMITSALDTSKGKLSVSTKGNKKSGKFFFQMDRIDDVGEVSFGNDEGITLDPGETIYFNYAKWSGNKGSLTIEIYGSDGALVESQELKDTD